MFTRANLSFTCNRTSQTQDTRLFDLLNKGGCIFFLYCGSLTYTVLTLINSLGETIPYVQFVVCKIVKIFPLYIGTGGRVGAVNSERVSPSSPGIFN